MLRKFVHQDGSIYKRLYKDARSTIHKFHENPSSVSRVITRGRTEGQKWRSK